MYLIRHSITKSAFKRGNLKEEVIILSNTMIGILEYRRRRKPDDDDNKFLSSTRNLFLKFLFAMWCNCVPGVTNESTREFKNLAPADSDMRTKADIYYDVTNFFGFCLNNTIFLGQSKIVYNSKTIIRIPSQEFISSQTRKLLGARICTKRYYHRKKKSPHSSPTVAVTPTTRTTTNNSVFQPVPSAGVFTFSKERKKH